MRNLEGNKARANCASSHDSGALTNMPALITKCQNTIGYKSTILAMLGCWQLAPTRLRFRQAHLVVWCVVDISCGDVFPGTWAPHFCACR